MIFTENGRQKSKIELLVKFYTDIISSHSILNLILFAVTIDGEWTGSEEVFDINFIGLGLL